MPSTVLKFRSNGDEQTARLLEDVVYKVARLAIGALLFADVIRDSVCPSRALKVLHGFSSACSGEVWLRAGGDYALRSRGEVAHLSAQPCP